MNVLRARFWGFLWVAALACFALDARSENPRPLASTARPTVSAGGHSYTPSISPDGRFVVFVSHANDLSTNDNMGPWLDVFLRDTVNGRSSLISVAMSGAGGGNDDSILPSVSTNGLFVAFESRADNLVSDDGNSAPDVFLRDTAMETTRLISRDISFPLGTGPGTSPILSADGTLVVFEMITTNLDGSLPKPRQDLFGHSTSDATNFLISTEQGLSPGFTLHTGPSHSATVSGDGRLIAFANGTTNYFVGWNVASHGEIFVRNRDSNQTLRVSAYMETNFQAGAVYRCTTPAISLNGRFVVFKVESTTTNLFRRDLRDLVTVRIGDDAAPTAMPQVSADGRYVAYQSIDGIRVWDGDTGTNQLICTNGIELVDATCSMPSMSADGTRIAYISNAGKVASIRIHDLATGTVEAAPWTADGELGIATEFESPLLSGDGRRVVFTSDDSRLVASDGNEARDVFMFDIESKFVNLISARNPLLPNLTSLSATLSASQAFSADGRTAAFFKFGSELEVTDTNRLPDIYVEHPLGTSPRFLGFPTNCTHDPVISADGRYIAYLSGLPNIFGAPGFLARESLYRMDLVSGQKTLVASPVARENNIVFAARPVAISSDGSQVAYVSRNITSPANIYLQDLSAGTTNLISVNTTGTGGGNGDSTEPLFSPDARWLLFRSAAGNLTTNFQIGLFARDLVANNTLQINPSYAVTGYRQAVAISADSRVVASRRMDGTVQIFDLIARTSVVMTAQFPGQLPVRSISLDGTGRRIAFESSYTSAPIAIQLRDLLTSSNELISVHFNGQGPASGNFSQPTLTHDGRFVVFTSDSPFLVPNDGDDQPDVFVRDRLRQITLLVSINRHGTASGNGASMLPVLSADGRTLLFQSFASDLVEGDFNETADLFRLTLRGPDTDGDSLDDDWEIAYLGTLDTDGSGDRDGDGVSDATEFRLGTDPTDQNSVFQIMTISSASGNSKQVIWSSTPGRSYRVQFKDSINQIDWSTAEATVTPAGTTAVWTDPEPASSHRFYRAVLVD